LVQAILATAQFALLHVLIYKTEIVPGILCGCETWCLPSRGEKILNACDSRVVRGILCETEVGIGGYGRFCSELHDCYCSPYIINIIIARKIIHMWNVACMWYRRR